MRRIVLAACAVMALAGVADARSVGLPTEMIGSWCRVDIGEGGFEPQRTRDQSCSEFLHLTQTRFATGYGEYEVSCALVSAKFDRMLTWKAMALCAANSRGARKEPRKLYLYVDDGKLYVPFCTVGRNARCD